MGTRTIVILILFFNSLGGCHYYQEYRQMKGEADIKEERAELIKAQRLCLQKYEADPENIEQRCGMYQKLIQQLDEKSQSGFPAK